MDFSNRRGNVICLSGDRLVDCAGSSQMGTSELDQADSNEDQTATEVS